MPSRTKHLETARRTSMNQKMEQAMNQTMERKNQTFGTSMNQEMEQAKHQAKKEPNTWKQQGKQARTKLKDKDSHTSRFTSLPSHPFESDFETKGRLLPTKKQNHFIENKN
jgi:hypothetical protein